MHTNPFAIEAAQYAYIRPTYPDDCEFTRGGLRLRDGERPGGDALGEVLR
jgi:hypothetical protein